MVTLGRKILGFANKLGNKISHTNFAQLGNKIVKGVDNGLRTIKKVGDYASKGLGTVVNIADKLRNVPVIGGVASVVGGGASQLRSVVDLGRYGVDNLEKAVHIGKQEVHKTISQHPFKQ